MTVLNDGFEFLDPGSILTECLSTFSVLECSYPPLYVIVILNIIFLLVAFYFFTELILDQVKKKESSSDVMQFWFGVVLSIASYSCCEFLPTDLKFTCGTRDLLTILFTAATNIPYNAVTVQNAKIMKLFNIKGYIVFYIIAYAINILAYIVIIGVSLYMSFYPYDITLSFKTDQPSSTIFLNRFMNDFDMITICMQGISKMVFLICASYAFIVSKETKRSTTKKFQTFIQLLTFIVALSTFLYIIVRFFVLFYKSHIIYAFLDIDNRKSATYGIELIAGYIVEAIPTAAIAFFMYTVLNLKENGDHHDEEEEEDIINRNILKGLI